MSVVILIRREWENNTANGIARVLMDGGKRSTVRRTRQDFPRDATHCLRLGCTANIPRGLTIFNSAEAIHRAANKSMFRKQLRRTNPNIIPKTWFDEDGLAALQEIPQHLPVVIRPNQHQRGENFHVCNTMAEVRATIERMNGAYYISQFHNKRAEYRVLVAQGRVVAVIRKIPNNPNLPAWGRAAGWDRIRYGQWNLDIVQKVIIAAKASGLDLAAVDVIQNTRNENFVCEVNSGPEMGDGEVERTAWVIEYMVDNGKNTIELGQDLTNWRSFIHPAIDERATMPNGVAPVARPAPAPAAPPNTIRGAIAAGMARWA